MFCVYCLWTWQKQTTLPDWLFRRIKLLQNSLNVCVHFHIGSVDGKRAPKMSTKLAKKGYSSEFKLKRKHNVLYSALSEDLQVFGGAESSWEDNGIKSSCLKI